MHKHLVALALALSALSPQAGAQAGVQIKLAAELNSYADFGESAWERERNARDLEQIFKSLASLLAPGQTLSVEVLDVNLAGELEWFRGLDRIRVMRDIGWPMIELRFTLRQGSTVLRQGQERVSDVAYLAQSRWAEGHEPLAYERRMLTRWLQSTLKPT